MTVDSVHTLQAPGRQIVILEPVPVAPKDPLFCLSQGGTIPKCSFRASHGPSRLERYFRQLAKSESDVTTVDLDRVVCPRLPTCGAVVGNIIAWRNIAHVTRTFAQTLEPQVDAILKRQQE